jgi:uncharacterized protein (TIGR00255 family)
MIESMTGFGLAKTNFNDSQITIEIKTLNSKFLDLHTKLPKSYSEKELELRNLVSHELIRGKVFLGITIEKGESSKGKSNINSKLVQSYYNDLKTIAKGLGEGTEGLLEACMSLPDVITSDEESFNEDEWKVVLEAVGECFKKVKNFRLEEGKKMEDDLLNSMGNIGTELDSVSKKDTGRINKISDRIKNLLETQVGKDKIDENRLEQELVYYIEKIDINEEKVRLKGHIDYFLKVLKTESANGKKLGFIGQEIGREINTIGSKANDMELQQHVVVMKDNLEKIKELTLNVI